MIYYVYSYMYGRHCCCCSGYLLQLSMVYIVVVVASTFCFSVYDYLSFVDAVVIIVAVVVVIVVVMLTIYFAVHLFKLSS